MRPGPVCLAVLLAVAPAAAADLSAGRGAPVPSEEGIPACDDPSVLSRIVERQHWAEENTWENGVRILAITDIRQTYRTVQFVSAVRHRHCVARAALSDAPSDRLYYVISEEMGFASISWGVEFCMPRHDYWRVYDADCRVLR